MMQPLFLQTLFYISSKLVSAGNHQDYHNDVKRYKNKSNRPINLDMFARAVLEILKEDKEQSYYMRLEKQRKNSAQMYKGRSIQRVVPEDPKQIDSKLYSGLVSKPTQRNAIRSKRYHMRSLMSEFPIREFLPTMAKIPDYSESGKIPSEKPLVPAKIPGIKKIARAVWKTRKGIDFPSKMEVMSAKVSQQKLNSEELNESKIEPKIDENASMGNVNKRLQGRGLVRRRNLSFQNYQNTQS